AGVARGELSHEAASRNGSPFLRIKLGSCGSFWGCAAVPTWPCSDRNPAELRPGGGTLFPLSKVASSPPTYSSPRPSGGGRTYNDPEGRRHPGGRHVVLDALDLLDHHAMYSAAGHRPRPDESVALRLLVRQHLVDGLLDALRVPRPWPALSNQLDPIEAWRRRRLHCRPRWRQARRDGRLVRFPCPWSLQLSRPPGHARPPPDALPPRISLPGPDGVLARGEPGVDIRVAQRREDQIA